jgi:hypothetical protein
MTAEEKSVEGRSRSLIQARPGLNLHTDFSTHFLRDGLFGFGEPSPRICIKLPQALVKIVNIPDIGSFDLVLLLPQNRD